MWGRFGLQIRTQREKLHLVMVPITFRFFRPQNPVPVHAVRFAKPVHAVPVHAVPTGSGSVRGHHVIELLTHPSI